MSRSFVFHIQSATPHQGKEEATGPSTRFGISLTTDRPLHTVPAQRDPSHADLPCDRHHPWCTRCMQHVSVVGRNGHRLVCGSRPWLLMRPAPSLAPARGWARICMRAFARKLTVRHPHRWQLLLTRSCMHSAAWATCVKSARSGAFRLIGHPINLCTGLAPRRALGVGRFVVFRRPRAGGCDRVIGGVGFGVCPQNAHCIASFLSCNKHRVLRPVVRDVLAEPCLQWVWCR